MKYRISIWNNSIGNLILFKSNYSPRITNYVYLFIKCLTINGALSSVWPKKTNSKTI